MHQTPNLPGTSPVTDNPNPNNSQGMDPTGPGTDSALQRSEASISGSNPTADRPGREGAGAERTFRCADVGNADCRWEAKGRTEDELMPQIDRHAREAHGMSKIDDHMRSKIKDAIRDRAA
jgi:predicted small metal-binding protein